MEIWAIRCWESAGSAATLNNKDMAQRNTEKNTELQNQGIINIFLGSVPPSIYLTLWMGGSWVGLGGSANSKLTSRDIRRGPTT